jgi:uncharacterized protein Usg
MGCNAGRAGPLAAGRHGCQHIVPVEKQMEWRMICNRSTTKDSAMDTSRVRSETEMMLKGYGLTTAEMFYRLPDYRNVLNTFVWQEYDLAPDYPALFRFIEFWQDKIEGPLHSVRFTHRKLIAPGEWRNVVGEFRLH